VRDGQEHESSAGERELAKRERAVTLSNMLAKFEQDMSERRKPSLKMVPSKPFVALQNVPNPAYQSPEWDKAPKLNVTAWGRAYVGPVADAFWMDSVDRRAAGLRLKTSWRARPVDPEAIAAEVAGSSSIDPTAQQGAEEKDKHVGGTPIPVGMQGTVLVFGFALCAWSVKFGREVFVDDYGNVEKQLTGPMFSLHPVGPEFRWYALSKLHKHFSHPKKALEHLAECLDDKLKLGRAPQESAKAMDAWGLFSFRDDSVVGFLRTNFAPTLVETLDKTVSVLKQQRKKQYVNAPLFDMLAAAPAASAALGHTPGHVDASGSEYLRERKREIVAGAWLKCDVHSSAPSYMPPAHGGDVEVRGAVVWVRSRDADRAGAGAWEKAPPSPGNKHAPARLSLQGLDPRSPFMSKEQRKRQAVTMRWRSGNGRTGVQARGPSLAHSVSAEELREREARARWRSAREREREREKQRQEEAEKRARARATSLKTFDRACKLSLLVSDIVSPGASPVSSPMR
jgi:hypothetical protein